MPFRSHLGRSLDVSNRFNAIMIVTVVAAVVAALVLWLGGEPGTVFLAPAHVFAVWALLREIDPDHPGVALVAGAAAGAWVFRDGPLISVLAVGGLVVAARIVTSTTGRRPLPTDLAVVSLGGIAIGFTVEGWIAGFGIAIALYLDDRLSSGQRTMQVVASAVTAIGTTVVATLAGAFPEQIPKVAPVLTVAAGVIALLLVAREPARPVSVVDARHGALVETGRLHASRTLVGLLVFSMTLLVGADAEGVLGVVFGLALAVGSNEFALVRRRER